MLIMERYRFRLAWGFFVEKQVLGPGSIPDILLIVCSSIPAGAAATGLWFLRPPLALFE